MTWVTTKTAKFVEEEMVAVQYLPNNYSRGTDELIISLSGGAQLHFVGEEAILLWERFGIKDEENIDIK